MSLNTSRLISNITPRWAIFGNSSFHKLTLLKYKRINQRNAFFIIKGGSVISKKTKLISISTCFTNS